MATIPEEPHTNLEQYLNRLATGEGEIPAEPRTNVEQYLNYMIENGVGKAEVVTELPEEGKDGAMYVLVNDAEHPTKAYGIYTYADGSYVLVAQPVDQSVQLVTELPETGEEGVLYYLEQGEDTYDLYRWLNNSWVKVDTDVILYSTVGNNVDGAMTQKAVTDTIFNGGNNDASLATQLKSINIGGSTNRSTTSDGAVTIGYNAKVGNGAYPRYCIAIGGEAQANYAEYGTFVGAYTNRVSGSTQYSGAFGYGSRVSRSNEISIGANDPAKTYDTRYLANVTDPSLPQDAATKNYTDNLVVNYSTLNGSTAPTTATEAKYVGQLYLDTTADDMYYCSAITAQGTNPETYLYTWSTFGGGPTVVQTTGTSTTDVMSQNAVTTTFFNDPSTMRQIHIGGSTTTTGIRGVSIGGGITNSATRGIVIGGETTASGNYSVFIGHQTSSTVSADAYTVALGYHSKNTRKSEVSVGDGSASTNIGTRYIANVRDPQLAQDAATKNYVDTAIAGVGGATVLTNAEFNNLWENA